MKDKENGKRLRGRKRGRERNVRDKENVKLEGRLKGGGGKM